MPYIPQEQRVIVDQHIGRLAEAIKSLGTDNIEGVSNYVITKLLIRVFLYNETCGLTISYKLLNRIVGTLHCIYNELYHRVIRPYEEYAIQKNNDVNEYEEVSNFIFGLRYK